MISCISLRLFRSFSSQPSSVSAELQDQKVFAILFFCLICAILLFCRRPHLHSPPLSLLLVQHKNSSLADENYREGKSPSKKRRCRVHAQNDDDGQQRKKEEEENSHHLRNDQDSSAYCCFVDPLGQKEGKNHQNQKTFSSSSVIDASKTSLVSQDLLGGKKLPDDDVSNYLRCCCCCCRSVCYFAAFRLVVVVISSLVASSSFFRERNKRSGDSLRLHSHLLFSHSCCKVFKVIFFLHADERKKLLKKKKKKLLNFPAFFLEFRYDIHAK